MKLASLTLAACCLLFVGCTTCASPYDDTYSAFGGVWERDLDNVGRVGSAFSDVGHRVEEEAVPVEGAPAGEATEDMAPEAGELLETGYDSSI